VNAKPSGRLLAFNIRATRVGYVLFDGPKRLLDWGTRSLPTGEKNREARQMRIASLVALTTPSEIVICKARRKRDVNAIDASKIVALVRREAALSAIPCAFVGPKGVQRVFLAFGAANKYEMAALAAGLYPEVLWKLPPNRKRWQTEPRVMLVFDSLTVGLAYWLQHGHQIRGPRPTD